MPLLRRNLLRGKVFDRPRKVASFVTHVSLVDSYRSDKVTLGSLARKKAEDVESRQDGPSAGAQSQGSGPRQSLRQLNGERFARPPHGTSAFFCAKGQLSQTTPTRQRQCRRAQPECHADREGDPG